MLPKLDLYFILKHPLFTFLPLGILQLLSLVDQYAFLNANNSKNKELREWNPRRSDEQDVVMTSSGIPLSQIFMSKVICVQKTSRRGEHISHK